MAFYCLQGQEHIMFLRAQDTIGKLILIVIAWEQLLAGTSEHILSNEGRTAHRYQGESWVSNIIEFLNQANAKIKIHNSWQVKPLRENDSYLMDEIGKGEDINTKKIPNKCRIYLKVTTISDITTGCGKAIYLRILEGTRALKSRLNWPRQEYPQKKNGKSGKDA